MRVRQVLAALLAAAIAIALPRSAPAARTDVLHIGITAEPNSLMPLFALNDYEQFVERFIFDVLVTAAPDGRSFIPRLASEVPTIANGGVSKDGLTVTYKLRRNVRWHDGTPFNSDDVKFSFAAIMSPANNVPDRHGYDQVRSVDTPDKYTVVFHFKAPYAPAVSTIFSDGNPGAIVPAHLLRSLPNLNTIPFNAAPVGTGPYTFVRWTRGSSIELAANPNYYLGVPKIAKIEVRFFPDESTAINELRTGEIDAYTVGSETAYGQIKRIPSIVPVLTPIHGAANILVNMTEPIFSDVRVRRAIAFAIDKQAIVTRFTFGAAKVATADLPDFMWAYNPNVMRYPYDPAKSAALFRAAGWTPGADGVLSRGGKRFSIVLAYPVQSATARLVATTVQSYLRAAGVDAQLKGYPNNLMYGPYAAGGVYQTAKFDLAIYTMTFGVDPEAAARFECRTIPPNGLNYSRYCERAMDAAQEAGLRSPDQTVRKRAYGASQALLARDLPLVFLYWPSDVDAHSSRLEGYRPNPLTASWNAHEWSLRP
jgi:peptide/nickel transport system substrate-binding protein